jgi:hypothetical protein
MTFLYFDHFSLCLRTKTDVHRSKGAVIVQSIEGQVLGNPIDDLYHILVPNKKVDRTASPLANTPPSRVYLVGRVLVDFRRNSVRNVPRKCSGGEPIRDFDRTEIINNRI